MRGAAIALVTLAGRAWAGPRGDVPFGSIAAEAALGASYVYNTCADQDGCPSNGLAPVAVAEIGQRSVARDFGGNGTNRLTRR